MIQKLPTCLTLFICLALIPLQSATIPVGEGSYTTTYPGADIAGRNSFPSGTPQLSGAAAGKPVPTNDWWSSLVKNDHAVNLFNYPLAMRTLPSGLDLGLIVPVSTPNGSSQPLSDLSPIILGVTGLSATKATVDDYSDWTVTIAWQSGTHKFTATSGIAMPIVYLTKASGDVASVLINAGTASATGEILLITNSQGGSNFAVYAPAGSTWVQSGNTWTSTLAGKNYWSVAYLPTSVGNPESLANDWKKHAYVFPTSTSVAWNFNETTSVNRTDFTTEVEVKEGSGTTVLQGLLPHQWAHLASDSPTLTGQSFSSIRGEVKLIESNHFATEKTFYGILPTLPNVVANSDGFDPALLNDKISSIENDALATWTDSYNEGQVMNRLIQTARIADETGDIEARDKMIATIQERLEDWLTAEPGEVAFIFYYQSAWSALLGYPAGHGQDGNINDHHFHWGYFIHAASFMEQFSPGWADKWGPMINLLVRDAASPSRDDPLFPFLRNFSPFAGHSWANGFATFPFGNDQESTSESMQFNSSLIHWGSVTGNKEIRDLGIYLYTTEQAAVEEYWFDQHKRNFKDSYGYSVASRVWGNGYDNQTFWTGDIAAAYGIELYPIHGGSLYLGHNVSYATDLWAEMSQNTGILSQAVNDNLWHDIYWQYLAFTDPAAAIDLYDANPNRSLKFGVSDAQTYYWLHSMNALGQVDTSITANDPIAAVFNRNGSKTYTAHNYSDAEKTFVYSDGTQLVVPARTMKTSSDLPVEGTITTPFPHVLSGTSVQLNLELTGDTTGLSSIEIFDGPTLLSVITEAPFSLKTPALSAGKHTFYARINIGSKSAITGLTTVIAGDTYPYSGIPIAIPTTAPFDAGWFDRFEGGNGQDITYHDATLGNEGDFRTNENVDTISNANEGAVIGSISDKEWVDYTVDVASAGLYDLTIRYASKNPVGGGPFFLEVNGKPVSGNLTVSPTGGWETFTSTTLPGIALRAGVQTLRFNFTKGEMNLGRIAFSYAGELGYEPPVADAGDPLQILAPATSVFLDGSESNSPADKTFTLKWEQVFGPAVVTISDDTLANPEITGLTEDGLYRFRITIQEEQYSAYDEVDVFRGAQSERPPSTSIINPSNNTQAIAGQPLNIDVIASDPDGTVTRVDLYNGSILLGSLTESPYSFVWSPPEGAHELFSIATDNDGLTSQSGKVQLTMKPPTACSGTAESGDFHYEFSSDKSNPTLTFIPGRAGVGSNIVLLYYGTGGGPFPGYQMQPNTPFALNAAEGQTISFYFTYSVPEGGERNSAGNLISYTIGTCSEPLESNPQVALFTWQEDNFSQAELLNNDLEATLWGNDADPDGDTLSNYLEFLVGSDPRMPSALPIENLSRLSANTYSLRYNQRAGFPEGTLQLTWSTDLTSWQSSGVTVSPVNRIEGMEEIQATIDTGSADANEPIYVRLIATP